MNNSSLVVVLMTTGIVGCASAAEEPSPRATKTTGATATTEPAEDRPSDAPCVPEGTKANDKGVGAYCDAQTRCPSRSICTGDFGASKGAQFCTFACSSDAECGAGATCFKEARGSGCVPVACQK